MHPEMIFFLLFSILACAFALTTVLVRNPLTGAFFLVLSFANLAGLYVLLHGQFVAATQILVYAGAIVVLFIFVIMLLQVGTERWGLLDHKHPLQWVGLASVLATLAALGSALARSVETEVTTLPEGFGFIAPVAKLLFTEYFIAFQLIGVLLFVATIAVVLLGKRVV